MAIDWDTAVLARLFGVFGEPVTYKPAAGGSFAVTGIFDQAYREIAMIDETPATEETPVLGVRLSDFAAPPLQGDQLVVPSVATTYVVQDVRLDSHGAAKLMLNEVSSP